MENAELLVVILGAVLPLYPALWFIYRKIGEYDVICAEFMLIREEYRRLRERLARENTSPDGPFRDSPPRDNPLCEKGLRESPLCENPLGENRFRENQHGT